MPRGQPIKDRTGQRYGRLTVIERVPRPEFQSCQCAWWRCVCDCGRVCEVAGNALNQGRTSSCGCLRKGNTNASFKDIKGQKFGDLTAIERVPRPEKVAPTWEQGRYVWWRCECECGGEKIVPSCALLAKRVRSCGCRVKRSQERRKNARQTYFIELFSAEHLR